FGNEVVVRIDHQERGDVLVVGQLRHDLSPHLAASTIRFAIVSGCDISETWLALPSIVLAPIRFAMKRWRSGLMVRSRVATGYQLGFVRHAERVVSPVSRAL